MIWLTLALRNIQANMRRTIFALLGITIATVSLVIFASFVNQVRFGLAWATIHGGMGHFQIFGKGGVNSYSERPLMYGLVPAQVSRLERAVADSPEVRRAIPRLYFTGLVSNGPRSLSFSGVGVDPIMENAAFGTQEKIISGDLLRTRSPANGVVLGSELAHRLGAKPGSIVTLLTPTVSGALNALDMTVVGIEETGIPDTDLYLLRSKLLASQSLLATKKISTLIILADKDEDMDAAMQKMLGATSNVEARTWRQLTPFYDQVLDFYNTLFAATGLLIGFVTSMGVATVVLTSVLERSREIGVMRALGIKQSKIRTVFAYEAMLLTAMGLLIGTLAAGIAGLFINFLDLQAPPPPGRTQGFPLRLMWDWYMTADIWLSLLAITIAVSWFASRRIASLNIMEALRTL